MGNCSHNSRTFSLMRFLTAVLFRSRSVSLMKSPINCISVSFIPRTVTIGVPSRIPLVVTGERLSNGIVIFVDDNSRFLQVVSGLPAAQLFKGGC